MSDHVDFNKYIVSDQVRPAMFGLSDTINGIKQNFDGVVPQAGDEVEFYVSSSACSTDTKLCDIQIRMRRKK